MNSLEEASRARVTVALALPGDLDGIEWRRIEQQDLWVPKAFAPPLIEYTPGHQGDGTPIARGAHSPGRFWVETSWWDDDGGKIMQSPELLAASRKLMGWVRRNWVAVEHAYESPTAHEVLEDQARANAWRDKWHVALDEQATDAAAQIEQWRRTYRDAGPLLDDDIRVRITGPYAGQPGRVVIEIRHRPPVE